MGKSPSSGVYEKAANGRGSTSKSVINSFHIGFSSKNNNKLGQLETLNYKAGKLDFDGLDPELGLHLLSLHWNRQVSKRWKLFISTLTGSLKHHSHLITYRPAFMRDMACQGPYFSKLLLNAIYFGSCKFSPRQELKGIHTQFRERVRELLGGALDRSSITTIQAMLVMTNSLFALGDERSAAWIYAGIAFRMLIDLGAHVDGLNSKTTEEDLEIRRRVFWGAFGTSRTKLIQPKLM